MASNTSNLGLYKKDPVADAGDTFNVQTMMNDNWDKIDAAMPGANAKESPTPEDSILLYDSADNNKPKKTLLSKWLEFLKNTFYTKAESDASLSNKVNKSGDIMTGDLVMRSANAFTDYAWQTTGIAMIDKNNARTGWLGVGGNGTQNCDFWLANDNGDVSLRPKHGCAAKVYDAPIATATPPEKYDLPLAEGVGIDASSPNTYSKDQMDTVRCEISAIGTVLPGAIIATLPVGYRSERKRYREAQSTVTTNSVTRRYMAILILDTDGTIKLAPWEETSTGGLHGAFDFPAT